MSFETLIGRRYLRAKKKQAFISLITVLSIAGVTVGVMALIVVIAVMSGGEDYFKKSILGIESHILLMRHGESFTEYREIADHVRRIDGVKNAAPFIYTQAMLRSAAGVSGVILRGIDPTIPEQVLKSGGHPDIQQALVQTGREDDGLSIPAILLGAELAESLQVTKGDMIHLISPKGTLSPIGHMPSMKRFQVAGTFKSGFLQFDETFAYVHLEDAQKIMRMGDSVTGIGIQVRDIYQAAALKQKILDALGFPFWAQDWMQRNQSLFLALRLEKIMMFIILTLIILVAAFNISSTLIMMVMGKTRDIAILKAMGATDRSIRVIFVFKGMIIGAVGTLLGMILGIILCVLLKQYDFITLPNNVYYFTKLPVKLEFLDVLLITLASMGICFLSTIYPARQASKLNPVDAIRFG